MKFIPILFSTPMVQGVLDDSKERTRRTKGLELINDSPNEFIWLEGYHQDDIPRPARKYDDRFYYAFTGKRSNMVTTVVHCPYGKPGDILWVRETWQKSINPNEFIYKADCDNPLYSEVKWKPSLFMPKEACRLFLKVKSVHPERLHQISDDDCFYEGIIDYHDGTYKNYFTEKGLRHQDGVECLLPRASFQSLWCSINGLKSWENNHWVWVVEFERIERPSNFLPVK